MAEVAVENKPFWQSKKFWMTVAGILAAILPLVLGAIPKESAVYAVLAAVAAAIGYVTAQGKVDTAKVLAQNPSLPPK